MTDKNNDREVQRIGKEQQKSDSFTKEEKMELILFLHDFLDSGNEQHKNLKIHNNPICNNIITKNMQFSNTFKFATDTKRTENIPSDDDDFIGQFECIYLNCGKRLKNNICLMWHLWAHVVQQNPTESEEITNLQILEAERYNNEKIGDEGRTDVARLSTCPECLLIQPNPHRIHLHYHRVHKRDGYLMANSLHICNICEQVISEKDMNRHIQGHQLLGERRIDLPYPCRYKTGGKSCGFRVSNRAALIEHFTAKHQGTFILLCPFCLHTFAVPPNDRRNRRIKAKDYCQHVLMHVIEKPLFCSYCVARFPHSSESQYQQHLFHHTTKLEQKWIQWNQTTREICNIKRSKTQSIGTDIISQRCLECKQELRSFLEHYEESLKKCDQCEFETFCAEAFYNHQILEICKPENSVRWPLGVKSHPGTDIINSQKNFSSPIYRCSKCHFQTTNPQKIAEHIAIKQRCTDGKIQIASKFDQQDESEARLFGLLVMEDINEDEIDVYDEESIHSTMDVICDGIDMVSPITIEQQATTITSINDVNSVNGNGVAACIQEKVTREKLAVFMPTTKIPEIIENKVSLKYLLPYEIDIDTEMKSKETGTFMKDANDGNLQNSDCLLKTLRLALYK